MKKLFSFLIVFFIISFYKSENLIQEKPDRLTFFQTFDPEYMNYIFNSEEKFVKHGFFVKDEKITKSGKYSYKWANQEKNSYVNLDQFLPEPDENGYRDFTEFDSLYITIYSEEKTSSTFIIALNCQEVKPTRNAYFYYYVTMGFKGWKELKISLKEFTKVYNPDLSKVTGLKFYSKGWNQIVNPDTVIYIDKFFFTKAKYEFNMNETEINDENYSGILKRLIYTMTYNTLDETKTKIVKDRVNALIRDAKNNYLKMNKNGLPFEYEMTRTSDMSKIYDLIHLIAIGYATEGGELYKDEQLREDLVRAYDYMYENYYNRREDSIFSIFDNWWDWEIGSAQNFINGLICIYEDLPEKILKKYLEPLDRYDPLPSMTMSNRVNIAYISIFSAVLQKDYKRIAISIDMLRECFNTVEKSDGFYDDGSFIQHGYYSYIGEYGDEMMTALSVISYCLDNSIFRLDEDMKAYQYNWIIKSILPSMYNGGYMDLIRGRSISRNIRGDQSGKLILNTLCLMVDYLTDEENINYLKPILKNVYQLNKPYLRYVLTPASLIKLEEYENDEDIKPKKINDFAKVFSRIDKAISQVNGVGIGISMSSSRIGKYESINGENTKGWYTGDGMTYIYLNVNDYASNYWPYINYYRLPGTTITNAKRQEGRFTGLTTLTNYDFVGGTYSSLNMVSAMQFGSESPGNGFNSTLVGNKAYFVFGEQLICLGNSINSEDNYDVETIIENKNLTGKLYFEDKTITDKIGNITSKYIYIENYGGIYLPKFEKVKYNITKNNFLEIYFSHGKKIKNESYSYMIFPKINRTKLKDFIDDIEIISNNNIVSAVKNKKLNVTEYVFWKNGTLGNVKAANSCTLIVENDYIYISDPSHKSHYITISVGKHKYQIRVEKGYTQKIKIYK